MGTEITSSNDYSSTEDADPGYIQALQQEIEGYRQKILELNKLADIGQLSAGILHEIKNPVSFVTNFSRLSQGLIGEILEIMSKPESDKNEDDLADQKDLLESLSRNLLKINENGKRIERIIQGMLSQTRSDGAFLEPTDLNLLLEDYTKLSYQSLRAEDKDFNVTLDFQLDPGMGEVKLSRGEFGRVILNLVNNACYAVNEKRKASGADYAPKITIISHKNEGVAEVKIRDNGIGIPPDIVAKLFQPFFTTKPHGKGTGLGLSLTYKSIVETHKGSIEVTSSLGEITEFVIQIPIY